MIILPKLSLPVASRIPGISKQKRKNSPDKIHRVILTQSFPRLRLTVRKEKKVSRNINNSKHYGALEVAWVIKTHI